MKKNLIRPFLALTIVGSLLPVAAQAQLRITEVESSEAGALHGDWWELSNFGGSAVDLTGYKFNDSTGGTTTQFFTLPALSIAPGESIIFVESNGSNPMTASSFQSWWGSSLSTTVQIVVYTMSGIGLSSAGDQVNLWDASDAVVDGVTFGAATAGISFVFDNGSVGRSPAGLSANGVGGAFTAAENSDIGSPGVVPVPEPSVLALAGLGLISLLGLRRLKNRQA